jgi:predicted ATP-grasp superfamily ATP-dependent carboligase
MNHENIIALGACVRSAAQSIRRAGYRVAAADCFADEDLLACGPACRVDPYPQSLPKVAERLPPGPWLYTGALENHPELVERIATQRELLGNPPEVLRAVRDPALFREAIAAAGLAAPPVAAHPAEISDNQSWLLKPRDGTGGSGVRAWTPQAVAPGGAPDGGWSKWYLQRQVPGMPCGAAYVAAGGRAVFLGLTRQRLGRWPDDPTPYCYSGSVGPLQPTDAASRELHKLGNVLASRFSLRGLFGVDVVIEGDCPWPVEINPRYTAAMEVLERGLDVPLLPWHVAACRQGLLPQTVPTRRRFVGKAIVWARSKWHIPDRLWQEAVESSRMARWPDWADIPARRSTIEPGHPIMTLLVEAADEASVDEALRRRETDVLAAGA